MILTASLTKLVASHRATIVSTTMSITHMVGIVGPLLAATLISKGGLVYVSLCSCALMVLDFFLLWVLYPPPPPSSLPAPLPAKSKNTVPSDPLCHNAWRQKKVPYLFSWLFSRCDRTIGHRERSIYISVRSSYSSSPASSIRLFNSREKNSGALSHLMMFAVAVCLRFSSNW